MELYSHLSFTLLTEGKEEEEGSEWVGLRHFTGEDVAGNNMKMQLAK